MSSSARSSTDVDLVTVAPATVTDHKPAPAAHLRAADYVVESVPKSMLDEIVHLFHYSKGGANTATFRHGLFRRDDYMSCLGVAWWMPPTRSAAEATWPNWQGVLNLSRLALDPEVPTNGASFLLGRSIRLIRRDPRWECLVTYADEAQGHTGAIYRATNWEYVGTTAPEAIWVDTDGRLVSRKRGPRSLTVAEMLAEGYQRTGSSRKHKFVLPLVGRRGRCQSRYSSAPSPRPFTPPSLGDSSPTLKGAVA